MVGMGAVVITLLFGVSAIINRNEVTKEPVQIATQTQTITVTIEGLYSDKNVQISSSETALEILQRLDTQDEEVQLLTREYSGLGVLVESIGGNSNGMNDEYWQYKVNGVMPQIGADKLEIKNGDAIEWYFARSEF